jgi:hypothetical protein
MKSTFYNLYSTGSPSGVSNLVKYHISMYQGAAQKSISAEKLRSVEKNFFDAEDKLVAAIKDKRCSDACAAIGMLRSLYRYNGNVPTQTDSGYFEIFRYFIELEEFVISVSLAEGSEWIK